MTEIETKIEYPCGVKAHDRFKLGFLDIGSFKSQPIQPCPLHGKKCIPKVTKK